MDKHRDNANHAEPVVADCHSKDWSTSIGGRTYRCRELSSKSS
jgi:hypothetical protein